jgi:hypothetical protein
MPISLFIDLIKIMIMEFIVKTYKMAQLKFNNINK